MSEVWTPHTDLEQEVAALRKRVRKLEAEVKSWRTRCHNERDHRLRIGKYAPLHHGPPAPRLYTVKDEHGNEKQCWLYMSDVLMHGIGTKRGSLRRWIDRGYIPDSPYRSLDGKRLWTKSQVELILELVERYRQNGRISWAASAMREELATRWERVGTGAQMPASRKRHRAEFSNLLRNNNRTEVSGG